MAFVMADIPISKELVFEDIKNTRTLRGGVSKSTAYLDFKLMENDGELKGKSVFYFNDRWGWDNRKTLRFFLKLNFDPKNNSVQNREPRKSQGLAKKEPNTTPNNIEAQKQHSQGLAKDEPMNSQHNKEEEIKNKNSGQNKFVKPTPEEIITHIQDNGLSVEAKEFWNYYQANGWKIGRVSMKSWKATLNMWHSRAQKNQKRAA